MPRIPIGRVALALVLALAACKDDPTRDIEVVATETGGNQVLVTVRNRSDRDVRIAACAGGDIHSILERRVVDHDSGAEWVFVAYVNGNCNVDGSTGYGLTPGAELEFTGTVPPSAGRYRFVVFRMVGDGIEPELVPVASNPFDTFF